MRVSGRAGGRAGCAVRPVRERRAHALCDRPVCRTVSRPVVLQSLSAAEDVKNLYIPSPTATDG